jgi:hypothetical protein
MGLVTSIEFRELREFIVENNAKDHGFGSWERQHCFAAAHYYQDVIVDVPEIIVRCRR